MDGLAPAADEAPELTDARGKHSLDAPPPAARHDGRSATGANGDYHIAAIDDGGKNEGRMRKVVHDIHRKTERPGARRHRRTDLAGARTKHRDDSGEIGGQWIALGRLDAPRSFRADTTDIVI